MPARRTAWREFAILLVVLATCGACTRNTDGTDKPTQGKPPKPAPAPAKVDPSAELAQLFDKVVRPEVVFPDAAQRALYEEIPVQMVHGSRVYGFALKPQPDMQKDRHFHMITVAAARRGKQTDPAAEGQTFGPNGGFWDKVVRTADGRYELRLSEGMLLPDSVHPPEFDLERAAQALSSRYDGLSAGR